MSKPKDSTEAFHGLDSKHRDNPKAFIQWKGTDVCMDVYCECGCHSHVDAMFAYHVQCPACGKIYAVSPWSQLVEVEDPDHCIVVGEV